MNSCTSASSRVCSRLNLVGCFKGGIGLLTRLPGSRHSRDIDLLHLEADTRLAEDEIRVLGRRDLGDYLRFEIARAINCPLTMPYVSRLMPM